MPRGQKRAASSNSSANPPATTSLAPQNVAPLPELTPKCFTLKHTFEKISEFGERREESGNTEFHFGMNWDIVISRKNNFLKIGVKAEDLSEEEHDLDFNISLKINGKKKDYADTHSGDLIKCDFFNFIPFPRQIGWKGLSQYIVNDSLKVDVDIEITKAAEIPMTTSRNFGVQDGSDIELVVQGQEFHVSKMMLTTSSTFFQELFAAMPNKKKFILKNLTPFDFQRYLEVVYQVPRITDFSVEHILFTAENTKTDAVKMACEEYLLSGSSGILIKPVFELFVRYKLNVKRFLDRLRTHVAVKTVAGKDIEGWGVEVMKLILEKSLTFV